MKVLTRYRLSLVVSILWLFASSLNVDLYSAGDLPEHFDSERPVQQGAYHALDVGSVDPVEFAKFVNQKLFQIPEMDIIQKAASKLGLKVWLMGGAAATISNFLRWDFIRQKGDTRLKQNFFHYDLNWILHSRQDLDFIITRADGRVETEGEISLFLAEVESILDGRKFEARGLNIAFRAHSGALRPPVKDDENIKFQNSDTMSLGALEISSLKQSVERFPDIRDLKKDGISIFLRDLSENHIEFIASDKHQMTPRYREGMNPPILGAIRFLSKAFQMGLLIDDEDKAQIDQIVRGWDHLRVENSYVIGWINREASKVVELAVDLESAWNFLDQIGLRSKLVSMQNVDTKLLSVLQRRPLRSRPYVQSEDFEWKKSHGRTETAKSLNIDLIAHETHEVSAESITRNPMGIPNFFISRRGVEKEAAAYGAGVYFKQGESGSGVGGSGVHIQFKIKPDAILGRDFTLSGNVVIVSNKAVLETVFREPDPVTEDKYLKDTIRLLNFILKRNFSDAIDERYKIDSKEKRPRRSGTAIELKQLLDTRVVKAFNAFSDRTLIQMVSLFLLRPDSVYRDIFQNALEQVLKDLVVNNPDRFAQILNEVLKAAHRESKLKILFAPEFKYIYTDLNPKFKNIFISSFVDQMIQSAVLGIVLPDIFLFLRGSVYESYIAEILNLYFTKLDAVFLKDTSEGDLAEKGKTLYQQMRFASKFYERSSRAESKFYALFSEKAEQILLHYRDSPMFLAKILIENLNDSAFLKAFLQPKHFERNKEKIEQIVRENILSNLFREHSTLRIGGPDSFLALHDSSLSDWSLFILDSYFSELIKIYFLKREFKFSENYMKPADFEEQVKFLEKMVSNRNGRNSFSPDILSNSFQRGAVVLIREGESRADIDKAVAAVSSKFSFFKNVKLDGCVTEVKKLTPLLQVPTSQELSKKLPLPPREMPTPIFQQAIPQVIVPAPSQDIPQKSESKFWRVFSRFFGQK